MSKMPKDDGNEPIPLLTYRPNTGQQLSFNISSSVLSSVFHPSTRVISIFALEDCFIELSTNNSIEANSSNSHFIPSLLYMDISLGSENKASDNYKYLSVLGHVSSSTLYISERE